MSLADITPSRSIKFDGFTGEVCPRCGNDRISHLARYTIAGKPGVYCSAECRDLVALGEKGFTKSAKRRLCIHCRNVKPTSETPYCLTCLKLPRPKGEVESEGGCAVCGGKVSSLRKSETGTCSRACTRALKERRRRQRKAAWRVEPDSRKQGLQFIHS